MPRIAVPMEMRIPYLTYACLYCTRYLKLALLRIFRNIQREPMRRMSRGMWCHGHGPVSYSYIFTYLGPACTRIRYPRRDGIAPDVFFLPTPPPPPRPMSSLSLGLSLHITPQLATRPTMTYPISGRLQRSAASQYTSWSVRGSWQPADVTNIHMCV
jgi:hypothetical protein